MTSTVQHRRGTAAQHASFTGAEGEFTYDTTDKRIVAHDGSTAGGIPLAREDEAGIAATVAAAAKTTPVDADLVGIADSADSNALKKLTFANLATWFGSKLGAVTAALTGKTTPADADTIALTDSAASDATKKLTWANVKATLKTYNDTLYQPLATALSSFTTLVGTIVSGDLIYGSGAATLARLAKGTNGHVLTLAAGLPSWAAAASGASVKRNRIVNPAMQISSVNGNTSGTVTGYVPADNWAKYHVSSAGTLTAQRVQSLTPNGSKDRLRVTITAADASLAAGEYLTLSQNLIGQEVPDFKYGTASAIQSILRFGFKGPQGTYAIALHNSALNRSYVSLFTISAPQANTDTEQTITIAGDTTGTWLTDTGTGITVDIVLACGSTFQGTTGWQAGNILGTSGVSNGMGTISAVFEVFDDGLYADPTSSGSAPTWETPSNDAVYDGLAITPWVAYTPVFTGLGTVTGINFRSRRVGSNLEIIGAATAGTSTAVEAQMTMGFGGSSGNVTSDSWLPTLSPCGSFSLGLANAAGYEAVMEASKTYIVFAVDSIGGLTKATGTDFFGTGRSFSLYVSVPIAGW